MTTPQTRQFNPYVPINTMAIATLVISLLLGPVAILSIPFGHLALGQIRRTGERGDELAVVGLVFGYLWLAFVALSVLVGVVLLVIAV
jgi:hypothetical protein